MAGKASGEKFSVEERQVMKDRAAELKAAKKGEEAEADVLAKIAAMEDADRAIAENLHALMKDAVPGVPCKTWYGFPSYMNGKDIVVFFQPLLSMMLAPSITSSISSMPNAMCMNLKWSGAIGRSQFTQKIE